MKLWGGRFTKQTNQLVHNFNASLSFDQKFYEEDITGSIAHVTMLAEQGIDAQVINIHTIKPIDEEIILKAAAKTGRIFTVEEHSVIGGLGDAVAGVLSEKCPTKLTKIGINDVFGESGPAVELLHKYKLDAEGIAERVSAEMK